jgi:hypothetical protein
MKVVRNFIGYLLATCIVFGALATVLPVAAFAPDGPLLTILNRVSTFDFGRRKIGAIGAAQTVTVANSGAANLEIRQLALTGVNPNDFSLTNNNCAARVLAPDQTCTLTLNFAPTTPGSRSARLSIESNAPGSAHLISLTGVGVDPANPTRDVGPLDVRHGFPLWYQDDNGLRLTLCLDANGLCLGPLPDPAAQPAVNDNNINFPGEAFWWSAEANIARATGGKVFLFLSREAAFTTDAPSVGQQISFDRLRVRIDKLTAGRSYRITYPYGVVNLVADAQGVINVTDDIGCKGTPCDFQTALNGRAGVFLRWDPAVGPAAPVGYLGDPTVAHRVVGSPLGTNLFRVEGTNVGGQGINRIETDLFQIEGKLFQ